MSSIERYVFRHDFETDDSLSTTLVYAIAEADGIDPMDLDFRMHDHFDTDALDMLFATRDDDAPTSQAGFFLEFGDKRITVYGDGHIVVEDWTDDAGSTRAGENR